MLGWPMIAFGWVSNLLQRGMASWKRLLEVLDVEPLVSDANANDAVQSIDGEVEFRNLTFSFGDAVVLRGVSFKVQGRPRPSSVRLVRASRHYSACYRGCMSRPPALCS